MNQIPPDSDKGIVREAVIGIIDWINAFEKSDSTQLKADIGPMVHVMPEQAKPASYSQMPQPEPVRGWTRHPNSQKVVLDPQGFSHLISDLTDTQWEDAKGDITDLEGNKVEEGKEDNATPND